MDGFEIIKKLSPAFGVSGEERYAAEAALSLLSPYGTGKFDERTGNAFFWRKGFDKSKKTILLDAHTDEIGFVITYITDDGFLKAAPVGGIDRRMLLASEVTVFGSEKVKGVITSTPPHLEKEHGNAPETADIFIDTGMTKEQAEKLITLGDKAAVINEPVRLLGNRISGKALDDRCGVMTLIRCIEMLDGYDLSVNVVLLLSSKEEIGEIGAKIGAFDIDADWAIAVDVSFADTIGENKEECGELGMGAMIGISPSLSREMSQALISLAKEKGIPYQYEVMGGKTGTNADMIAVSKGGIKTVTVSVPERYMHTPAEVIDLNDTENTAVLISEYIKGLE